MNVPEGVDTVTVEGRDLKMAIAGAAERLGLHPAQVDYKLDLSHFRSPAGVSLARSTVRIVAWGSDRPKPEEGAENGVARAPERAARPERRRERRAEEEGEAAEDRTEERAEKRRRGRGKKGEEREVARPVQKPDTLRGAEEGTTEASEFAQRWFESLLGHMEVEGTVTGTGSDDRVHLSVKAERAGRIVGKRGATLGSIRHLLDLALEHRFGKLTIDVDVGDDRPAQEREQRVERPRDRGERGRDRDRDRDRDRGRGRGRHPEHKLRALARRAAERALESGQIITINLELNSFDRRIVHLEVSEIEGVESHSEEKTDAEGRVVKLIQIHPLLT